MSKYNEVMENVKVSEDMRSRILANIEKEMTDAGSDEGKSGADAADIAIFAGKDSQKKKLSKIAVLRKYAGIAAALAVCVVGLFALSKVVRFGGSTESSTMLVEEEASIPRPNVSHKTAATEDMAEEAAYEAAAYDEIAPEAVETEAESVSETMTAGTKAESDSLEQAANSVALAGYKEYSSLAKLSKAGGTSFKEIEYLDSFSSGKDYYLYSESDVNVAAISYDVEGNTVTVREMDEKCGKEIPADIGISTADLVSDSIQVGNVTVDLFGDEDSSNADLGTQLFYIAQWTKDGLVYQLESSEALTYEDMKELMEQVVE
ncbi:MAG: DUF4367 domain-containing protein [Butyrivibrio sp.]|nr:DUF4367 domain-containing protein [Butyrivibrio sp.]